MFRNTSTRLRFVLTPILLAGAVIIGVVLWRQADRLPRPGQVVSTGQAIVGGPFHLTDQNGNPVSSRTYQGRYMLIYFGYTFCPDVCPATMGVMAGAMGKLGDRARDVVPIFITVDPARDTPAVLKQYVAAFGPRFVGLTGDQASITQVEKEFHVYARKATAPPGSSEGAYGVDHSNVIYLMGPDGKLVSHYDNPLSPDQLAASIRQHIS